MTKNTSIIDKSVARQFGCKFKYSKSNVSSITV